MATKDKKPSIDVKQKLRDFKGDVIIASEPTGKKDSNNKPIMSDKEMRLGDILSFALLSAPKQDTPDVKLNRFSIALKINNKLNDATVPGEIEFSVEELKTCIDASGEHLITIFYGRVVEILDPNKFK